MGEEQSQNTPFEDEASVTSKAKLTAEPGRPSRRGSARSGKRPGEGKGSKFDRAFIPPPQALTIEQRVAEKIRDKYFPKTDSPVRRAVKVVKKAKRLVLEVAPLSETQEVPTTPAVGEAETAATDREYVAVMIPSEQFELLSARTKEILTEAALAQERIAKDQEEIDSLRTETRDILRRMRAA